MKTYFYDNEVKIVKGEKKFIVYEIEHKGDLDIAERKVKTITQKLKRQLAGGLFNENCLPYNFKKDYTVINIPYSTRIRVYDKKDKFIIALIEAESR
jgi:hypothetical protein